MLLFRHMRSRSRFRDICLNGDFVSTLLLLFGCQQYSDSYRLILVFFPFWFIGAILLFNPLRPLPQTECGRTEEEQKEDLLIVRNTELKWSWRCVYALLGLALLVGVIVLLVLTLSGLRR
jgi:hypothetical protein